MVTRNKTRPGGFTLVELMLTITLLGVLLALAVPAYQDYKEKVRIAQAVTDITSIAFKIKAYYLDARVYPDNLAIIGEGGKLDPWGRPYEYLNLTSKGGNGGARRDKNLNPLNSDFDLYSRGKDGQTKLPISQKVSLDDVLRANDGRFVDLASKY
ncbi:MAG: prepilin-type N-terminal cleavage/methylation domain-containing protein [Pseudomonadota bacterium]